MVTTLLTVLLLSAPLRAEGAPSTPVRALSGADDVAKLCRRLLPTERIRPKGDAVERGEAEQQHETERDEAIAARYALVAPAAKISFAPYDGPEQRLAVSEPAALRLSPAVSVYATMERGLPVQVNAATARRILAAQAAGRLALHLVFDLPEDAVCGGDHRGQRFTLGVEPVEWGWFDGETELVVGSVAADRPPVSLAGGAEATVDVGEPIAGPSAARKAVLARRADLVACYAEGLRRSPALDGVVVVDLGARVAVSADSTGSADLAKCVERALGPLAGAGKPASVPIRFELAMPKAETGTGGVAPETPAKAVE